MDIIWLDSLTSDQLALDANSFTRLSKPEKLKLKFGQLEGELGVTAKSTLPEGTVGLPESLSVKYSIPIELPYECAVKEGALTIGPVIAYVVLGKFEQLNLQTLSVFNPRFKQYELIKGLIYVCTADSINLDQGMVEGYYYNPSGLVSGEMWKRGKFPLPNAVFNRSLLSQQKILSLRNIIGNNIFNSYWMALNKWNIWQILSQNNMLKAYLPYTEKLLSSAQLKNMLNKYDSVYIKPTNQSRGRGIMQLFRLGEGYLVADDRRRRYSFEDAISTFKFIRARTAKPPIIQQGVPFKIGNQHVDFRIYLQKNEEKKWAFQGYIGRIALEGSPITNLRGRASQLSGREALKTVYQLDDHQTELVENKMISLVRTAVGAYEERGLHIGDVAADLVLDNNLQWWLLELQLNYAAEKAAGILPPELFDQLMVTPFKYAKALAGFN